VEEIGSDAGEEVVAVKRWVVGEGFDQVEASLGTSGHGDGYGSVEFDDWGWG